jgi:hypothetical protein
VIVEPHGLALHEPEINTLRGIHEILATFLGLLDDHLENFDPAPDPTIAHLF